MIVENLLSGLNKVKQKCSNKWMACCLVLLENYYVVGQ